MIDVGTVAAWGSLVRIVPAGGSVAELTQMMQFGKRDALIVHGREPFNAETDRASLFESVTATDAFYVRNHGPVPELDAVTWRLRVEGLVERPLRGSLKTLQEAFRCRQMTATSWAQPTTRPGRASPHR